MLSALLYLDSCEEIRYSGSLEVSSMNRILIGLLLCLALSSVALAQQSPADVPATKADIEKYFEAAHVHEMMTQMIQAMSEPMHKMIHEQFLKDQDKLPPDFEARMTKAMDDMMAGMPWDEMIQAMIPAYTKHFTKGDMAALTAFYSSPVGQKILRELPAVTAESMQTMMPIMQKRIQEMTGRLQEQIAEMIKESLKDPAPAARKN
jgi:uncharacterized protein